MSLVRSQPGHSSPRGSAGETPGGKVPQMHRDFICFVGFFLCCHSHFFCFWYGCTRFYCGLFLILRVLTVGDELLGLAFLSLHCSFSFLPCCLWPGNFLYRPLGLFCMSWCFSFSLLSSLVLEFVNVCTVRHVKMHWGSMRSKISYLPCLCPVQKPPTYNICTNQRMNMMWFARVCMS